MGSVVRSVKKVAKAAFKVVQTVGKVVAKTVQSIGKAVENTIQTVGKAVESIAKAVQPLVERYAIQAALMAVGIPPQFAAPMSAGFHTLAKGGKPEDAIKSAATVVVIDKVGVSVGKAAKDAGFTAAQAAAAQSAAQSAVATAAAGGDINAALQAAAMGAVGSTAGNSVLSQTKNAQLAAFTQSAVISALRGQKIDEAILNGASAATVSYMRQIQEEQKKADTVLANRDAAYNQYSQKVNEYNALADKYNNSTSQAQADDFKRQLDAKLAEINSLSTNIGNMNQQLATMQGVVDNLTKKATEEISKTGGDYSEQALADLRESEQALVDRIQEVAGRQFGAAGENLAQLASLEGGTDVPLRIEGYLKNVILRTENASIYDDGEVVDRETGETIGQLNDEQLRQLQISLREMDAGNIVTNARNTIADINRLKTEIQAELQTVVNASKRQELQDILTRADSRIAELEGEISDAQKSVESAVSERRQIEASYEQTVAENRRIAEEERVRAELARQEAERLAAEQARLEQERLAAEQAAREAAEEEARIAAEEEARRIAEEQARVAEQERVAREEAERARIAAEEAEQQRIAAEEARAAEEQRLEQERVAADEAERARVAAEEEAARAVEEPAVEEPAVVEPEVVTPEPVVEPPAVEPTPAPVEPEISATIDEEILRQIEQDLAAREAETAGEEVAPPPAVIEQIDDELGAIEEELAQADEERAQTIRDDFAEQVRQELDALEGEITGAPPGTADELQQILDEYDAAREELAAPAPQEEETGAVQEPAAGGEIIEPEQPTDEDIMDLIGLTEQPEEEVPAEEEVPEGEFELGGGEGEGEPTVFDQEAGATPATVTEDRTLAPTTVVAGERAAARPAREASAPGISSRVTGESLVGVLGEKEPLFGGDEDNQRAVWNRRSLRLRRALGL